MADEGHHQDHHDTPFTKADFHIHTPESKCYAEPQVTPGQLVGAAHDAGLGAIAVTDHNTAHGIDSIRRLGPERGIIVFPGIEISTTSGHVLALFDTDTPVPAIEDFLDYIGTSAAARGDGTIQARDPIEDVLRKIVERGGIAIAAHVERWPTGFLQTKESRRAKQKIHGSDHLAALEITQPQNREAWNNGMMRGFPRGHACVQGSDAHALEEIGRRPTYLKLVSADLEGLRLALIDHENRVRFPDAKRDVR